MSESQIQSDALRFISFSAAMHSLIALDKNNQRLTNSITWTDTRSAQDAKDIKERHDGHASYRRSGTPIHAMSPLSKLVSMRHEATDIFQKAAKFISIKEYVFYRLFGKFVVDYSVASATGLFKL